MPKTLLPTVRSLAVLLALFLILGLSPFGVLSAQAVPSQECLAKIESRVSQSRQTQAAWYSAHGGQLPPEKSRSVLHLGTSDSAVLVLHGFYSSPFDLRDLIEPLQAQGRTVLAPLITGFGAGYQAANDSRIEDWQASVREGIETLRTCYPKVTIVAHCLGGALALDQVINGTSALDISEMILLAPYVRTYYPGLNILNDMIKVHIPYVDLKFLRLLLGLAPENVLPIPLPPAGEPDEDSNFPLQAVESALDLQKRFQIQSGAISRFDIPVTAMVSDADQVVDGAFALDYLRHRFHIFTAVKYEAPAGVPHYMHNRSQNPHFPEVIDLLNELN